MRELRGRRAVATIVAGAGTKRQRAAIRQSENGRRFLLAPQRQPEMGCRAGEGGVQCNAFPHRVVYPDAYGSPYR